MCSMSQFLSYVAVVDLTPGPNTVTAMSNGIRFGLKGMCTCPVTACAGGTNAVGDAFHRIRDGYEDLAVCGGAGSDFLADAVAAGAEAFLTGEVKHHEWLMAAGQGLCLMAAGHHATEHIAMPQLAEQLQAALPGLTVALYNSDPTRWDGD